MTNIEFNKKMVCGTDFVAVKILENGEQQMYGNILLPSSYEANGRLAHCVVTNIGKTASDKTGVAEGDYVMIDRLATFAHTAPAAALKYDSVICKTNESKTDFYPLKDTMFVEPDEKTNVTNVGGVLVQNYDGKLNTGKIVKIGFDKSDDYPFNVGDKVMMVKGGDFVQFSDKKIHIFKKDMIVCTIED